MKKSAVVVFVILVGLSLSACGRRGPLEPPPGAAARPAAAAAPSKYSLDGGKRETEAAVTPPRDPFILDPLL